MTLPLPLPAYADIEAAAQRIDGAALRTPMLENPRVNDRLGGRLLIKAEPLQRTGSFKFRGAYNFIRQLDADRRKAGIVAWSSGNHAQGVAEAARLLATPATIVMPSDAPAIKVANTRASGAEIVLYDRLKDDREAIARGLAERDGRTPIPPYDHPWIIAGQGTIGPELIDQAQAARARLDAVIAPCSGGGLSSGIATAVKAISPATQCFAAEPAGFDDLARSLASGTHQRNERLVGSFCDALLAPTPGNYTFALARQHLNGSLVATDDEVATAMEFAFREFKLVVEPGGAVGLACVLNGALPIRDRTVCVVCSGGNVDGEVFRAALATAARRVV
ncbi:threonine/serine dehydratase [Reyranella sp. CPCC 100927]|uniref:threonine ammonia-lyase n=1 Tax=Reyranella sp. CPCC 100927 TaxID=2599616 RepID=UPI0011B51711|nr:threonine/serine dehydratase [Reyranella sp. CPCC 100927]TWT13067.1 threonine/serine dehydratase [Reyranella sp. CPCC 100927]